MGSEIVESAPHPNPLRASFARLDPSRRGAREHTLTAATSWNAARSTRHQRDTPLQRKQILGQSMRDVCSRICFHQRDTPLQRKQILEHTSLMLCPWFWARGRCESRKGTLTINADSATRSVGSLPHCGGENGGYGDAQVFAQCLTVTPRRRGEIRSTRRWRRRRLVPAGCACLDDCR